MPDVITMLRMAIDKDPPLGFDAADVVARAQKARRRRRAGMAGLGVAGVAAGTALALSLTGVLGAAPARSAGTIQTTTFTLVKHANGTATLTMNPNVLLEPSTLRNDLRQDGIPAVATTGRFCSSHPSPAGFARVVTGQRSSPDTLTIKPAAMPTGTELSFGYFKLSSGQETVVTKLPGMRWTARGPTPSPPCVAIRPSCPDEQIWPTARNQTGPHDPDPAL